MPKGKAAAKKPSVKVPVLPIEKTVIFNADIDLVWKALTDPEAIGSWMEDDGVEVDLKKGGKFAIFAGDTTGLFVEIDRPKALEYTWRMSDWKNDWPDSIVRWELEPAGKKTKVRLIHKDLPDKGTRDSHDDGWDVYFLEPMKKWLASAGDHKK